jgi:acyl-coenzyme A synthetase/AMP-(fatty) acid ligase
VGAALLVCGKSGVDLLLARDRSVTSDSLLAELGVDGILDDGGNIASLPREKARSPEGAVFLCSSGTTGVPKVARHRLAALMGRIRPPSGNAPASRWLLTYHPASFAGLQVSLTAISSGSTLIACEENSISKLAAAAIAHAPTHISGTPTFWRAFAAHLLGEGKKVALRQITLGGEAVDQSTLDLLRRVFPESGLCHIYASTEAGSLFAVKDGREGFPAEWLEMGIDGVGLRIREGMLEVLSPRAMVGYAAATSARAFTEDGWVSTGDVVRVEGDRVLFSGRADNMINVGGSKVLPEEVEAAILRVPSVRDARVYGKKNPITGALVAVDIVAESNADQDAVRSAAIAMAQSCLEPYKVPRIVRFVDQISYNASGKKDRH